MRTDDAPLNTAQTMTEFLLENMPLHLSFCEKVRELPNKMNNVERLKMPKE